MQREREFLILCARHSLRGEEQDGLREFVGGGLDWWEIIALSGWHGIVSLVFRSLQSAGPDEVPADVMARLRHLYFVNSARSLCLASELSRILASFEKREIPLYPFRDPPCRSRSYGDPMRGSRWTSISSSLTLRSGTRWMSWLHWGMSRASSTRTSSFPPSGKSTLKFPFPGTTGRLKIELQWAVGPPYFGFREEELKIWEKRRVIAATDFPFPRPAAGGDARRPLRPRHQASLVQDGMDLRRGETHCGSRRCWTGNDSPPLPGAAAF